MDGCLLLVRASLWRFFARTAGLFPPLPQGNQISIGRSRGRKFEFKLIRMCVRRRVAHLWVLREEAVIVVERVVVLSVLLLRGVRVWPLRVVAQVLARRGVDDTRGPTFSLGDVTAAATEVRTDDRRTTHECIFNLHAYFLERSIANLCPCLERNAAFVRSDSHSRMHLNSILEDYVKLGV